MVATRGGKVVDPDASLDTTRSVDEKRKLSSTASSRGTTCGGGSVSSLDCSTRATDGSVLETSAIEIVIEEQEETESTENSATNEAGEDGGEELILLYDNADDDILQADNEVNEAMLIDDGNDVVIPALEDAATHDTIAAEDEDILLSSDDEAYAPDEDVRLELLKRPMPSENTVEIVEIIESDEEFPVCIGTEELANKEESVNMEEKKGYIKEFIENEGLAIIHSAEFGLVLFHVSNVWINGQKLPTRNTRSLLQCGMQVRFYDKCYEGPQYKVLTKEEVLVQAVVVWTGKRPKHLMKEVENLDKAFWKQLDDFRKTFMLYMCGEVFSPCSFARTKGKVKGYFTTDESEGPIVGLLEVEVEDRKFETVYFHEDDVRIFRKPLSAHQGRLIHLLPVGCHVFVDARRCHIPEMPSLQYQAVAVLAGAWPDVPFPTLLPGGPGTYAPRFEALDERSTFYYLELKLDTTLKRRVKYLQELLTKRGSLEFDWRGVNVMQCKADSEKWREYFVGKPKHPQRRHPRNRDKINNTHTFKAPPIRRLKTKEEMDTNSEYAHAGSSVLGSVSGVSGFRSRVNSRLSDFSDISRISSKSRSSVRTWYNPEAFPHGGLRLKAEMKSEAGNEDGPSNPKRVKKE